MFAITPRLLLRPSWPEDAVKLYHAIADQGIVRNLATAPWPYDVGDAEEFAQRQHSPQFPNATVWTRDGSTPKLVGACGLGERNGDAELGYWIARPYWGQGFATEAGRAVISAARTLGHKKLVAGHFLDNPASGKVLHKLGFRTTGRVEQTHSKARGLASPCVMFEHPLGEFNDGDADGMSDRNFSRVQPSTAILAA